MKKKLTKKELYWILYDVGNSAFTMVSVSLFALFFTNLTDLAGISSHNSDAYWSYATSIITIIAVLIGPFIGTISDNKGFKKPLFLMMTLVGVIGCILLGIPMNYVGWLVLFVITKVGYNGALMIYDSMLVDTTTEDRSDKISALGYAFGYIGSLVPFVAGIAITAFGFQNYQDPLNPGATGMDASLACPWGYLICFAINALWWLAFTIPLLKSYKQNYFVRIETTENSGKVKNTFKAIGSSYKRVWEMFKYAKKNLGIFLFLIAFFLYIDGVYSIIELAIKVAEGFGVDQVSALIALIVVQVIACPCAIGISYLAKKFGTELMIFVSIIGYLFITLYAIFITNNVMFWVLAIAVGMFQGGIQSLSRSYFTQIIPKNKSGELFSLFDAFGKGASFIGTLLFGIISQATESSNLGIIPLSCLVFAGGVVFIYSVRVNRKNKAKLDEINKKINEDLNISEATFKD